MKKILIFNRIMWAVFFVGTIITLVIVYRDVDTPYATKFVMGYVGAILIFGLYVLGTSILKLRKLESMIAIRKRIFRFIRMFILFSILGVLADYFFKEAINFGKVISIAFGVSFGMSFLDLVLFEQEEN